MCVLSNFIRFNLYLKLVTVQCYGILVLHTDYKVQDSKVLVKKVGSRNMQMVTVSFIFTVLCVLLHVRALGQCVF